MKNLVFLPMLLTLMACSHAVRVTDTSPQALASNDTTVIIEGCGNQPVSGYTYCRVQEGTPSTQGITFHVPDAECDDDLSCVYLKVFSPAGQVVWGLEVPKGIGRYELPWQTLTGKSTFEKDDRGFWGVLLTWKWKDKEGRLQTSAAQGEIRLRVLAKEYVSLNSSGGDENFAWVSHNDSFVFKMTTAGRSYVGPRTSN